MATAVKIDPELMDALKVLAAKDNISLAILINAIIKTHICMLKQLG